MQAEKEGRLSGECSGSSFDTTETHDYASWFWLRIWNYRSLQTWRRLGYPRPGPVLNALDEAVRVHKYTLDDTEVVARLETEGAGCPGAWCRLLCNVHLTA